MILKGHRFGLEHRQRVAGMLDAAVDCRDGVFDDACFDDDAEDDVAIAVLGHGFGSGVLDDFEPVHSQCLFMPRYIAM